MQSVAPNANAVIAGTSLTDVDPNEAWNCRMLAKEYISENIRPYTDICDAPTCKVPKGRNVLWINCDECDRWFHMKCQEYKKPPRRMTITTATTADKSFLNRSLKIVYINICSVLVKANK